MKKNIFLAALMVATLVGCTNYMDEGTGEQTPTEKSKNPIAFTPMEIHSVKAITRATQLTKPTITTFGVSTSIYPVADDFTTAACGSYWFNEGIVAETGISNHYWPGADYKVSFFAYAPYGAAGLTVVSENDLGYPRYTYTVPSAITSQSDFITADVLNHSGEGITEPVALTFSHRCADLRFNVYNQGSASITVHSLGVYGVKYTGTYCESTSPKWTLSPSTNSTSLNPFLLSVDSSIAAEATLDITGTTNHFIMLPQTVTSGTQIFDVDATVNGVRKHYYHTLDANLELEEGKVYTFTLTLGEGIMIVDSETDIQNWGMEVKYLGIGTVGTNNTWTQPNIENGNDNGIEDWIEE